MRRMRHISPHRDGVALELSGDRRRCASHLRHDRPDRQPRAPSVLQLLPSEQAEVTGMDDLLDDIEVDTFADRASSPLGGDPLREGKWR